MNLLTVWKTPLKIQPHKMVIKNWNLMIMYTFYTIYVEFGKNWSTKNRFKTKFIINPFQKILFKNSFSFCVRRHNICFDTTLKRGGKK